MNIEFIGIMSLFPSLKSEWSVAAEYCNRLYKESKWSKVNKGLMEILWG